MTTRPVIKTPVTVARIVNVGKSPLSERHMGERERLIREVRMLLENAAVTFSYAGDFDLKKFLQGITLVKTSRSDEGLVIVSEGKLYKFYIEDIGPDNLPVSVNKSKRIRLEDGEQAYYLFQV